MITCPVCSGTFVNESGFGRHWSAKHADRGPKPKVGHRHIDTPTAVIAEIMQKPQTVKFCPNCGYHLEPFNQTLEILEKVENDQAS